MSDDNTKQTPAEGNLTAIPQVTKGGEESILAKAWNTMKPSRAMIYGIGGVALGGALSLLYNNNEGALVSTTLQNSPMHFHSVNDNTTLIQQGNNLAIQYENIVCPVPFGWPIETTIVLGSKGDASFSPNDENTITTILGRLGITRDVNIARPLDDNAQELMNDLYAYSERCIDKMNEARQKNNETSLPPPAL